RGERALRARSASQDDPRPRLPGGLPGAAAVRPGGGGSLRRWRLHAAAHGASARAPHPRRRSRRRPFLRRPPRRAAGRLGGLGGRPAVGDRDRGAAVSEEGPSARELLQRDRAMLVVVDLQEKLLSAIAEKERVLRRSVFLLRAAGELELPVVLTTQYAKGLGPTVREVREQARGVEPVDKVAFGCFGSEAFLERLATRPGRDQLLVAGIESHICVEQTVLGALERDYRVHVAVDA